MKKYIVIITLCFSTSLFAQDDKEMKTLFGNSQITGGFGGFELKTSPVRDNINLFIGGHGGIIFNNHTYIGVGGYGISTREKFNGVDVRLPENDPNRPLRLDMTGFGYGGLYLGYTVAPNNLIHIDIPVLIGAGGVDLSDDNVTITNNDFTLKPSVESSAFFVAEPGLNIEFNMASFCKLGLGGGYRWIYGTNLENISDEELSGWTANFSLRFGKFN